jgi:U5 small nuclear ribonucleoprotein component
MLSMLQFPSMVRNVAVVGHLHHGKTALLDMLVFETHVMTWDSDKQVCSANRHTSMTLLTHALSLSFATLILTLSRSLEKSR